MNQGKINLDAKEGKANGEVSIIDDTRRLLIAVLVLMMINIAFLCGYLVFAYTHEDRLIKVERILGIGK